MLRRRCQILLCSSSSSSSNNNGNNNNNEDSSSKTTTTKSGRAPLPPIQSSIKEINQPDIAGLSASSVQALAAGKGKKSFSLRDQSIHDLTRVTLPQDQSDVVKSGEQPRTRPYAEFTGESVAKPSDVAAGTAPFKDKGSVMRPSSIPSSPKPEWMSNTERKWMTAPLEFGKSTVDTRREWFRVMHYNTLVDRFSVPDPVAIGGKTFNHVDRWDQHVLKIAQESVEKYAQLSESTESSTKGLLEKGGTDSSPSNSLVKGENGEIMNIDENQLAEYKAVIQRHNEIAERERTTDFYQTQTGGFMTKKTWEKKIKKGDTSHRGKPRPDAPWQTTPIANVEIFDEEEARWHNRGARIAEEIVFYDPDILTVNEMNKVHFSNSMWRALRSQGYGSLYVSARSDEGRRRVLRNPDRPLPYYGDIGNCVFFHKARFFPMYQPGADTNTSIPYLHLTGLRDRLTNLSVFLGVLQFTAGDNLEAVRARESEARGVVKALHGLTIESDERLTNGVILCGDLNNVYADEPCVNVLRDRYRSAYDVIGGARWTSWYKRAENKDLAYGSMRHTEPSYEKRHADPRVAAGKEKKSEIAEIMKKRATTGTRTTPKEKVAEAETATAAAENSKSSENKDSPLAAAAASTSSEKEKSTNNMIKINADEEEPKSKLFDQLVLNPVDIDFPDQMDDISLRAREKLGVVKTTSDYVMYEDRTFSVLRVLDCPPDEAVLPRLTSEEEQDVIDAVQKEFEAKLEKLKSESEDGKISPHVEAQMMKQKKFAEAEARHLAREFYRPGVELLPNDRFPSHHIPLLADICWNRWSFEDQTDSNTWNPK